MLISDEMSPVFAEYLVWQLAVLLASLINSKLAATYKFFALNNGAPTGDFAHLEFTDG